MPVSVVAWFPSLSVGSHMAELWLRHVSAGCMDNCGNYQRTLLVEAYRPAP